MFNRSMLAMLRTETIEIVIVDDDPSRMSYQSEEYQAQQYVHGKHDYSVSVSIIAFDATRRRFFGGLRTRTAGC